MDSSDDEDVDVVTNNNIPTEEKVEKKRGPGRPRKSPQIAPVISNGESTSRGKRERGRPPRVTSATPDFLLKRQAVKVVKGRKPGRPRKNPQISPVTNLVVSSNRKGKWGRPPKVKIDDQVDTPPEVEFLPKLQGVEVGERKKPGRPRKSGGEEVVDENVVGADEPNNLVANGYESETNEKSFEASPNGTASQEGDFAGNFLLKLQGVEVKERKKRGRPRKSPEKIVATTDESETCGTPGRKRGRPAKDKSAADEETASGQPPKKVSRSTKEFACVDCPFKAKSYQQLKGHRRQHQRTTCPVCHKSMTQSKLRSHMVKAAIEGSRIFKSHNRGRIVKRHSCPQCPASSTTTFVNLRSLKSHQRLYHGTAAKVSTKAAGVDPIVAEIVAQVHTEGIEEDKVEEVGDELPTKDQISSSLKLIEKLIESKGKDEHFKVLFHMHKVVDECFAGVKPN